MIDEALLTAWLADPAGQSSQAPFDTSTSAELVTFFVEKRELRLRRDREAAELKTVENAARAELVRRMVADGVGALASGTMQVKLKRKTLPVTKDWKVLYEHIRATGAFELLQRRISQTAIQERWDASETVPGVESFVVEDLGISKL